MFTKESYKLMSFFVDNKYLMPIQQTLETEHTRVIFAKLFNELHDGFAYINELKAKMGDAFYSLKIDHIENVSQIMKPSTFSPDSFPEKIRKHIDAHSLSSFTYSINIFDRKITIIFLTEEKNPERIKSSYNNYVDYMLVWLYIVNSYASKQCSTELKIFIYHTSAIKVLPQTNIEILNESHINTAFTRTCRKIAEIVVYRKEEWFKVFMHETFHNFGLDFSNMDNTVATKIILSIFPVKSDVNLFESYTEFWARIMNALFCSYLHTVGKKYSENDKYNKKQIHNKQLDEFLINAEILINMERMYAFFQMVKVLNFMDLNYNILYEKGKMAQQLRDTLYKENTNILSYYVITLVLLNNYQEFILWCNKNNNLLQFKQTPENIKHFCDFIVHHYKSKSLLLGVQYTENVLKKTLNTNPKKNSNVNYRFLLKNLRMTICEMG